MWKLIFIVMVSLHSSKVFPTQENTVFVDNTFLFLDESGRITCKINFGETLIGIVRWEIKQEEELPRRLYTYWPQYGSKVPESELEGRSDYEHVDGNSTLIIHNVTQDDQGNYTCSVQPPDFSESVSDVGEVLVVSRLQPPEISVDQNPVNEGNEAVFRCIQTGNESQSVQFEFDIRSDMISRVNMSEYNLGTLRIINTTRFDDGNYTCRIRNIAGPSEWSEPVKLDVFYPPGDIVITTSTNDTFLFADDNVTITCSAIGGRPRASSVQWKCGELGSGNGTLASGGRINSFIGNVEKKWNNQNCSCLVYQSALQEPFTRQIELSVSWPPNTPSLRYDYGLPWLENKNYTALCRTTDVGNPVCTYSWFKGNQSLQLQQSDNNITLHVTKDDNNKQLKCVLQNLHTQERPAPDLHVYSDLDVQYAPLVAFNKPGHNISRREFENLTLECVADSNPGAMKQQFLLIHQQVGRPSNVRAGENTWELGPVSKEDAGTYTCHVTVNISHPEEKNLTGQDQRTLVVYYLHINTTTVEQEVTEYETVNIECTGEAVPYEVKFSRWMHVNRGEARYLNSTFQNHTRAVITLQSIKYHDAGMYRCKAGNSIYQDEDEKTAEQHVIVRYTAKQPEHPVEGLQIYTGLGQNVSLNITVDAYPTEVNFIWSQREDNNVTNIMNDECTLNKTDCLESIYHINDVTMSDLGHYTVHANNSVLNGSDFHFTLIQREGPGTPSIIISRSFPTPVSVEIWWRAGNDGGYTQTFSINYREPGEDFKVFKSGIPDKGPNVLHHVRVTPLDPATTYQFQVTAHNGHNGETMITSNQEEFRTLLRPLVDNSTLSVSRYGSMAYLIWKRPDGAFDTQRIEQYEITGKRFKRAIRTCIPPTCLEHGNMSTDVTSYNVSGLEEGKTYRFSIVLFYRGDIVQRQEFTEEPELVIYPTKPPQNITMIAGIAAGGAAVLIIIVVIFVTVSCRRKKKTVSQEMNGDNSEKSISLEELKNNRKNGVDNKGYSNDTVDTALRAENDNVDTATVLRDEDATNHVTNKDTEHVTSNPPPGTDGLLYATVEFTEPMKGVSDKKTAEKVEKGMTVDSSCEYADIDHRKKQVETLSEPNEVHVAEIPEYAAVDYSKKKKPSVKKGTRKVEDDKEDSIPSVGIYEYAAVDQEKKKNVSPETEGREESVPDVENYEYAAVDRTKKKKSSTKRDPSQSDEEQKEEGPKIGHSEYAVVDYSKKSRLSVNADANPDVDDSVSH